MDAFSPSKFGQRQNFPRFHSAQTTSLRTRISLPDTPPRDPTHPRPCPASLTRLTILL